MRSTTSKHLDAVRSTVQRTSGMQLLSPLEGVDLQRLTLENKHHIRAAVKKVLEHVPLIVYAEDDSMVRAAAFRVLKSFRGKDDVVALEGPVRESIHQMERLASEKLPVVVCDNGSQAEEAIQLILERHYPRGMLALDNVMAPGKRGVSLIREYGDQLPPTWARILQSGDPSLDASREVASGSLDAQTGKISHEVVYTLADAYVKRFNHSLAESGRADK